MTRTPEKPNIFEMLASSVGTYSKRIQSPLKALPDSICCSALARDGYNSLLGFRVNPQWKSKPRRCKMAHRVISCCDWALAKNSSSQAYPSCGKNVTTGTHLYQRYGRHHVENRNAFLLHCNPRYSPYVRWLLKTCWPFGKTRSYSLYSELK